MRATVAIVGEQDGPFRLEEVDVDEPGSGEVLVQIVATGICHTDGLARHGDLPFRLPGVLGHEGAGKGSLLQGLCSLYDAADPWDHDSDPWDGHYGSDPPTFSTRRLDRNRI